MFGPIPEYWRQVDEYIIAALYVDDKTMLPEEEWVLSDYDGKWKRRFWTKDADFQVTKFE